MTFNQVLKYESRREMWKTLNFQLNEFYGDGLPHTKWPLMALNGITIV